MKLTRQQNRALRKAENRMVTLRLLETSRRSALSAAGSAPGERRSLLRLLCWPYDVACLLAEWMLWVLEKRRINHHYRQRLEEIQRKL